MTIEIITLIFAALGILYLMTLGALILDALAYRNNKERSDNLDELWLMIVVLPHIWLYCKIADIELTKEEEG